MKASEIQIGDWLEFPMGIQLQVDSIAKSYQSPIKDDALINYRRMDDGFFLSELKPIPITKEILEKNEFFTTEFFGPHCYFCSQNGYSIIKAIKNNGEEYAYVYEIETRFPDTTCISSARFKYVHELQHALRLCGIEKEIEL